MDLMAMDDARASMPPREADREPPQAAAGAPASDPSRHRLLAAGAALSAAAAAGGAAAAGELGKTSTVRLGESLTVSGGDGKDKKPKGKG
jgi:hypothetical protein